METSANKRHTASTESRADQSARYARAVRAWTVPVFAIATAAVGNYLGLHRAIGDVRADVKVERAEHRATIESIDRRLATIEEQLPRDIATQRDLTTVRDAVERELDRWIARHEAAYHRYSSPR